VSFLPSIEGTISAKPFENPISGTLSGPPESPKTGTVRGSTGPFAGTIAGDSSESPENSAIAELGTLISSLSSLSAQAQSLPLSAPVLPALPQSQGYQPQPTDYTQFNDGSN
jgi:hypothetical protein